MAWVSQYTPASVRKTKAARCSFAIGEECGPRVGEVANIRLSDIDTCAQTIFVRLPTKNKRTRTVRYHDKVKKYLGLWLAKRDPRCTHDHLLHNNVASAFDQNQLDVWFKTLLSKELEPMSSFKFHRLRHTWATRLLNSGIDLAVLRELGGWADLNSLQRYVKILPDTIRREYEAAYAKMQQQESPDNETLSLMDFALMNAPETTTTTDSAS